MGESIAPSAEEAYLFRHATARDAAYQLLPPSQRARLHGLALDILEEFTLGAGLDAVHELAEHARLAQENVTLVGSDIAHRELRYLRLSAVHAANKFENESACRLWERFAAHRHATPGERAEALTEAGILHWMLGRREPALRCLGAAIDTPGLPAGLLAFCLVERGTLYRDVNDNTSATRDLQRALEIARKVGDKNLQLRALGNLCTVQDESMTQAGVRELYAPVLRLARETGNQRAVGITEGQIGLACLRGGNFSDAERHLRESIRVLREAGDKLNEGAMLGALGRLFRERPDGDRRANLMQALEHYRAAVKSREQLGYVFQKTEPLIGLASTHRMIGMLSEAEKYAAEAQRLALEIGDAAATGAAYLELGAVYEAQGRNSLAERTWNYGFLVVEDSQADDAKVQLLEALARLLAEQGEWEDADVYARNAQMLAEDVPDKQTRTRVRRLLNAIETRRIGPSENS